MTSPCISGIKKASVRKGTKAITLTLYHPLLRTNIRISDNGGVPAASTEISGCSSEVIFGKVLCTGLSPSPVRFGFAIPPTVFVITFLCLDYPYYNELKRYCQEVFPHYFYNFFSQKTPGFVHFTENFVRIR